MEKDTRDVIEIKNINRKFGLMESFKTLRTNLMYTENLQVISVTSTVPDEGKTVVAFQLANSFAQMDKKVLLIDCDLRRSSLNDYLVISRKSVGLTEALTKQSRQYIKPTNIDNLFVILAGKRPPNPSELLSSPSFEKLIEQLKESFDYIIIDTPPTTVAMDAVIVGRVCDGTLMVIRNEFIKKKLLKRAKQELERNGVRIVGAVLNRVKKNQIEYSGYGYEKYY